MKINLRNRPVQWVGEILLKSGSYMEKTFYRGFKFGAIHGEVGDFVLISNADAVEPDTVEGCDIAEIVELYEIDQDDDDPFRAVVKWYSRPKDIPKKTCRSLELDQKLEVVQDTRPFDNDVSIETFFSKCQVIGAEVNVDPIAVAKKIKSSPNVPVFVCRYRLSYSRHSTKLEPYLNYNERCDRLNSSHSKTNTQNMLLKNHTYKYNERSGNDQKFDSDLLTVKKTPKSRKKDCVEDDHKVEETRWSEQIKTKASQFLSQYESYVCIERLQLETIKNSRDCRSRSRSPVIPRTEPVLKWCGVKDDKNNLQVLEIPIDAHDSSHTASQSSEYFFGKDIDSGAVVKTKSFSHAAKLKDRDITLLLDDEELEKDDSICDDNDANDDDDDDDAMFIGDSITTDASTCSYQNVNKKSKDMHSSTDTSHLPGRKTGHIGPVEKRDLSCSSVQHEMKTPTKSISGKENSYMASHHASPARTPLVKKHLQEQWVANVMQNSPSCRNRSNNKEKLMSENKLITGTLEDVADSSKMKTPNKIYNRSGKISTPESIKDLEPLHKSTVVGYFLQSMEKAQKPHHTLPQNIKEHWVSVLEDDDDGASTSSSSARLKLYRTQNRMEDSNEKAITPKKIRRQGESELNSQSKSKRIKTHDGLSTPETPKTDHKTLGDKKTKYKRIKTFDLPSTPESSKTDHKVLGDQKSSSGIRSSSRKHKPNRWFDDDTWSTSTNTSTTPNNTLKRRPLVETPLTPKPQMSRGVSTPLSSKRGSARRLLLTPSVPTRVSSVSTPSSVLEEARARLHVSAVPKSLPCREKEFENIYRFLEGKILDGVGGCMYISGVPGTGKTATVQEVVRSLQKAVSQQDIPKFQFIELNGMRLTEPRQAYVQLLKAITGHTMTAEQAQQMLERRFSRAAHRRITTLLLVDELDLLWTKRQDVVYNLLDWPTKASSHLVVLTIANTMDLPERLLMGRVTSRLGLTRVTFHPYTHKQLQEIVMARVKGLKAFDADAVQLVARKVAAVSGDARRALDICRRATELAEENSQNNDGIVTMQHVDQALCEMIASTKVQAIRFCSKMEQMFLQAVAAEIQRTGLEETVFEKVYIQLRTLCVFDGYTPPSITESLGVCARLGSCRLLLTEHSRTDVYQRVLLNVSSDDIHYALLRV